MSKGKIGLFSLTALVLSSMIGSGIFSLPQNMAEVAGAEALLSGWLITGFGIILLRLSCFLFAAINRYLYAGVYTLRFLSPASPFCALIYWCHSLRPFSVPL
ncbi:amino acid permease, partial [Actinobacillus pleuropneumoniae]|uniref:amino acid permease n=1 Tax=Actinobacillus pleuropneumoniae TaxID=715 RepID=UPI0005B1F25D